MAEKTGAAGGEAWQTLLAAITDKAGNIGTQGMQELHREAVPMKIILYHTVLILSQLTKGKELNIC